MASGDYSLVVVRELLIAVASLVAKHWLPGPTSFSSCSTWIQKLHLPGSTAQVQ